MIFKRELRLSHQWTASALLIVSCLFSHAQAQEASEGAKLFSLRVHPIIADKCIACHGDDPDDINGAFDMRSRKSTLRGGESFGESVLIPGNGDASILYRVVAHTEDGYEMPPKLADRLSEEQTWWIRDWIDAGASWPSDQTVLEIQREYANGEQVATSKALSEVWQNRRYESKKLWAYRALNVDKVPDRQHPVDWFLNRRLHAVKLPSAGDASALEMVRRMSFGLTGLPPSRQGSKSFTEAYLRNPQQAVIDFAEKLMSSPHYGEHFGQHWLDVTRYADSSGFANDYARPNAWRYRDYVVRSFNTDKPFDQFVKEQIAGDELDASDSENLIATGFLRMGPWEHTAMSVFKETRQFWLDDVTDSVGQTFLGHAMQCAKCHDHKFDPVPTRDYYSMMAVFSTTQFADRSAPFVEEESQRNFESADEWVTAKLDWYGKEETAITKRINRAKQKEAGKLKVGENGLDPADEATQSRARKNIQRHTFEVDRTKPLAHSVYTGKTIPTGNVKARIKMAKDAWRKGEFDPDVIYTGGSVYAHGDSVVPHALSAAESLGGMESNPFPQGQGKRRLALANWIADEKNPLTARVIVNRVWSWHFGKGIAGNPNNLGGTGGLPTHPALLDYLSSWFIENDWSIKKLNALIISSDAYRRSTRHPDPDQLAKLDAKDSLYAAFVSRRLTAEELRDAMLVVSGEMNDAVGGIPSRPDINPDIAFQPRTVMSTTASVYEPDALPELRNRRSLYAEKVRGLRDPFYEAFNQPGMDDSCELRETSTIAPQALTMLNAEETQDRTLAFAARLLHEHVAEQTENPTSDIAILKHAFELALGRDPSKLELKECLGLWAAATAEEESLSPAPREFNTEIERTVMAEKTGEPYTFIESMPAYKNYVPDLQRSDVGARTRGLAHVCLVLFNLNEFAYLN